MRSAAICLVSTLVLIALPVGAWVLYTYPPAETSFYPRCVFKSATGLDCPGCGSTRAAHAILHGRFGDAFRLNPMLFLAGAVFAFATPSLLRGEQPAFMTHRWFGRAVLAVLLVWWVGRNVV